MALEGGCACGSIRSKVPWLELPKDVPAFESFYKIDQVWPAESRRRIGRNVPGQA